MHILYTHVVCLYVVYIFFMRMLYMFVVYVCLVYEQSILIFLTYLIKRYTVKLPNALNEIATKSHDPTYQFPAVKMYFVITAVMQ